jgi:DNA polymerase III delta subunit
MENELLGLKFLLQPQMAKSYFIVGEEIYLREKIIEKIKFLLAKKFSNSFETEVFYGDERDYKDVESLVSTFSLFSRGKFIILKNVDEWDSEEMLSLVNKVLAFDDTYMAAVYSSVKFIPEEVYNYDAEEVLVLKCYPLKEEQIAALVKDKLRQSKKSFTEDVIFSIMDAVGTKSMQDIALEVDKILTYINGKGEITQEDVNFVSFHIETKEFLPLFEIFSKRDVKLFFRALKELSNVCSSSRDEQSKIFFSFYKNVKLAFLVKYKVESLSYDDLDDIIGTYNIRWPISKYVKNIVEKYTLKELYEMMLKFVEADFAVKLQSHPPLAALEKILFELFIRDETL